jgi:predicted DNA-binding protein
MRGAWAQRKYRGKKKDKRAYSIVLPVKTKQQLDRISKELSLSLAETVEKLIQSSKEQQESFFDNEHPKLHQKRADDSIRRDANDYRENSEIFAELLTLSLIDLSILKIRHSARLDSEAEISEIERLSTNLLEEFLKEGNEGLKRRMSNITLNNPGHPSKTHPNRKKT